MAAKKVKEEAIFTNEKKEEFLNCDTIEKLKTFLDNYDIKGVDKFGNNILHYYLNNEQSFKLKWDKIIPEILNRGLDINAKQSTGQFGRSPLHLSVFCQRKEITEYLINSGADVNSRDAYGKTVLSVAVSRYCYLEQDGFFIELLINRGADVYLENNYGISAISLARNIENYDVAKYFEQFDK